MSRIIILLFTFVFSISCAYCEFLRDDIVKYIPPDTKKPEQNTKYDYTNTDRVIIPLKITAPVKSQNDLHEGQDVCFEIARDVRYQNEIILTKNTPVYARVETIINSGMNGIPASVIFGNFEIAGIDKNKLSTCFEVFGHDRSLWVFPLKWALTPLPPTGSLTNFIKGGRVRISKNKEFHIFYYPNWGIKS